MADYTDEEKQKVKDKLGDKAWKVKELAKVTKVDKKAVKKIIKDLEKEGFAAWWSSGSTAYITSQEHLEDMEKKRSE